MSLYLIFAEMYLSNIHPDVHKSRETARKNKKSQIYGDEYITTVELVTKIFHRHAVQELGG